MSVNTHAFMQISCVWQAQVSQAMRTRRAEPQVNNTTFAYPQLANPKMICTLLAYADVRRRFAVEIDAPSYYPGKSLSTGKGGQIRSKLVG